MLLRCKVLAIVVSLLLISAKSARAGSVNIVINEDTGTESYQFNGGSWKTLTEAQAAASSSWDSMITKPGTADAGSSDPNTVGSTLAFSLQNLGTGSFSWINNSHNPTAGEGALIITEPGSSTAVSDLLIFDGSISGHPGIYVYDAPTLVGGVVQPNTEDASNTVPVASYGYTGGVLNSKVVSDTPGGDPITTVNGLESDLDWNGGFVSNASSNNNIAVSAGGEGFITDPISNTPVFGYKYHAGTTGPGTVFVNNTTAYDTTIYFEEGIDLGSSPTPLPSTFWCGLSLMALFGAHQTLKTRRQF
jgi:hypothetical protein